MSPMHSARVLGCRRGCPFRPCVAFLRSAACTGLGAAASNDCAATTKWEHAIPASALARGPFILEFPFEKKPLEARIGTIEGVVLETTADGTSRIVVAQRAPDQAKKLGMAEGAPRKIVVTYKTNRCK
jgi:hypothetical protein